MCLMQLTIEDPVDICLFPPQHNHKELFFACTIYCFRLAFGMAARLHLARFHSHQKKPGEIQTLHRSTDLRHRRYRPISHFRVVRVWLRMAGRLCTSVCVICWARCEWPLPLSHPSLTVPSVSEFMFFSFVSFTLLQTDSQIGFVAFFCLFWCSRGENTVI